MDILRRNTDYAIRALVNLGRNSMERPVPARELAKSENISHPLTSKLMQKLQKAGVVKSRMGPAGGFELRKDSSRINLLEVIETIQGRVALSGCFADEKFCDRSSFCLTKKKLQNLQDYIEKYFAELTLADLIEEKEESK